MDSICMRDLFHFHCKAQAVYDAVALNFPEGLPVAKEASTVNLLLRQTSITYRGLTASKTTQGGITGLCMYHFKHRKPRTASTATATTANINTRQCGVAWFGHKTPHDGFVQFCLA